VTVHLFGLSYILKIGQLLEKKLHQVDDIQRFLYFGFLNRLYQVVVDIYYHLLKVILNRLNESLTRFYQLLRKTISLSILVDVPDDNKCELSEDPLYHMLMLHVEILKNLYWLD